MPETVLGIPLHPLVVHAVVVLVPLSALGTVLVTLVSRWRGAYGWLVVIASALALGAVPLATRSGGRLEDSLGAGGPVAEKINEHQEWGERVIWPVAAMFVLNLVLMLAHRAGRSAAQTMALAGLAAAAALTALAFVLLTGHLGSQAVWDPTG
ncbi:MAG: DUF2231 domain-containing protein [Jiangellaceae bacterium]